MLPRLLIVLLLSSLMLAAIDEQPDLCFERMASSSEKAERLCSDAIARLSYLAQPGPAERTALASAYSNRGVARTRTGDFADAALDLGEALVLDPENPLVLLNRGNLQLAQGQAQAALLDYRRVRELVGNDSSSLAVVAAANSALAYRGLSDPASAEQILLQVAGLIDLNPPDQSDDRLDLNFPATLQEEADSNAQPAPLPR